MKKKTAKKSTTPKKASKHFAVSFIAIISVFLIAVAFVFGTYYMAHPESHVLGASIHATPTQAAGGQVAVNFVKYDTAKKSWVYIAISNPTQIDLLNSNKKVVESAKLLKNSQGYAFKQEPLGTYYVRFLTSAANSAAVCNSSCFSIPTSGYNTTNPVKVVLTSTNLNSMLNVYLQVKK